MTKAAIALAALLISSASHALDLVPIESSLSILEAANFSKLDTRLNMSLDEVISEAMEAKVADGFIKVRGSLDTNTLSAIVGFKISTTIPADGFTIATFRQITLTKLLKASRLPEVISIQGSRPVYPNPAVTVRN